MAVVIREAIPDDGVDINYLCRHDLGYECDTELVRKRISGLDKKRERIFVAELDDEIIGFVHVEDYALLYAHRIANILGLAVSHDHRRKGVGNKLMNAVEEWARSEGMSLIRVTSGNSRKNAHEFYRDAGFSHEKEQIRFIKKL